MGMSRLADRERYQHGNGPTLVAQLDPEAALAEGRAALELSQTTFVAETSLPTKYGRFRVRAYRHSVRLRLVAPALEILLVPIHQPGSRRQGEWQMPCVGTRRTLLTSSRLTQAMTEP